MIMLTVAITARKMMVGQLWFGVKRNYIEKNIFLYVLNVLMSFVFNTTEIQIMASPQKDNGFTPIADEIVEALMMINLSGNEHRILWFIFRKT